MNLTHIVKMRIVLFIKIRRISWKSIYIIYSIFCVSHEEYNQRFSFMKFSQLIYWNIFSCLLSFFSISKSICIECRVIIFHEFTDSSFISKSFSLCHYVIAVILLVSVCAYNRSYGYKIIGKKKKKKLKSKFLG